MSALYRRLKKLEGKSSGEPVLFFSADRSLSDVDRKNVEAKYRLENGIPEDAGTMPIYSEPGSLPSGELMTADEFTQFFEDVAANSTRIGDPPKD